MTRAAQELRQRHALAQHQRRRDDAHRRHQQQEGPGLVEAALLQQREPAHVGEIEADDADEGQRCPLQRIWR